VPRLTSRGQVTIPFEIRLALGLRPGSKVEFIVRDGEAVMCRTSVRDPIDRWVGFLASDRAPQSTDELMDELRGPVEP